MRLCGAASYIFITNTAELRHYSLLRVALGTFKRHRSKIMARLLHKPRIFQQDHSPKKSNVRQLRKKFYVDPFLCSTTPIIAAMPNKENDAEGDVQSRKRISLAVSASKATSKAENRILSPI